MSRSAGVLVIMAVGALALHASVEACGDKFLRVGRSARFQRAYASMYPGKVLIYTRPSTDSKAAIRDPKLHKALRQAGHGVSVIEDWALLDQALKTVPVDVILVDVAEAARLRAAVQASGSRPETLFVASGAAPPPSDVVCRLKSSDRTLRYLDEVENAMKARKGAAPKT